MNPDYKIFIPEPERCEISDPMGTEEDAIAEIGDQGLKIEILPKALIKGAQDGDRESVQELVGQLADWLECEFKYPIERPPLRKQYFYMIDWLIGGLRSVSSGTEPNKAFGWTGTRARRGRKPPGVLEKLRRQIIATEVIVAAKSEECPSMEEAVAQVAEATGISEEMVWKYYSSYKDAAFASR